MQRFSPLMLGLQGNDPKKLGPSPVANLHSLLISGLNSLFHSILLCATLSCGTDYSLVSVLYSQHLYSLLCTLYTLLSRFYSLLGPLYSLLYARYSLLSSPPFYFPLFTVYSPLTTLYLGRSTRQTVRSPVVDNFEMDYDCKIPPRCHLQNY